MYLNYRRFGAVAWIWGVGCFAGCQTPDTDSFVVECENTAVREIPCGIKDQGFQKQVCRNYIWVNDGRCDDPTECFDGEVRRVEKACGLNQQGTQLEICSAGQWAKAREEGEDCTDEQSGDACGCTDPDVCVNGAESEQECGEESTGSQLMHCVDGQWSKNGMCERSPRCQVGQEHIQPQSCGFNRRGDEVYTCIAEDVWELKRCVDPDECAHDTQDERDCETFGANNLPQVQRKQCVDGQWSTWSVCADSDRCIEGDFGEFSCGTTSHRTGTESRSCHQGYWDISDCWQTASHIYAAPQGLLISTKDGPMLTVGDNRFGTAGTSDLQSDNYAYPTPTLALDPQGKRARFSASETHQCAINAQQGVRCWGQNDHGQLGAHAPTGMSADPSHVPLPASAQAIAVGEGFSCALLDNSEVHCWGLNDQHQLGRQTSASTDPTPARAFEGARLLTAGDAHVCAAKGNDVYCWGANNVHQASEEDVLVIETPTHHPTLSSNPGEQMSPGKIKTCSPTLEKSELYELSAGRAHTIATWRTRWAMLFGIIYSPICPDVYRYAHWIGVGENTEKQLAHPSHHAVKSAHILKQLDGRLNAVSTHTAGSTTCVAWVKGVSEKMECVGSNARGQFHDNLGAHETFVPVDEDLMDGESAAEIALSHTSLCVLLQQSGRIRCRGDNTYGQLGDGTQESRGSADFVLHAP